jgi:hypothetical protein
MSAEFPLEIWLEIMKLVSLRELSILQTKCWFFRSAVNMELARRTKRGLQNIKSAVYLTVNGRDREMSPLEWLIPPLTRVFRSVCYRAGTGGLRFGGPQEDLPALPSRCMGFPGLGPRPAKFRGESRRFHTYAEKLPDQMKALYLSFPDDDNYTGLFIFQRDDQTPIKPTDSIYSKTPLRLCGFFCVDTGEFEAWIVPQGSDFHFRTRTGLPLQLLEIDFDFVLSHCRYRCGECKKLVPWPEGLYMTVNLKTVELGECAEQGETLEEDRLRPRKGRTEFINILSEIDPPSTSCRCK